MGEVFAQIKDKWFIIMFIASMILWYGNTNNRLNTVEAAQEEQEDIADDIVSLKIDMAVVKSSVLNIEKNLSK